MEADRGNEDDSTILCMKAVFAKEVSETERIKDDDIHLSWFELLPNSHISISKPISVDTLDQPQTMGLKPKSSISANQPKGPKTWKCKARQSKYPPRQLCQPQKRPSQDGGTEHEDKPNQKIQRIKTEGIVLDTNSKVVEAIFQPRTSPRKF